jgi:hypothetical protein
LTEIKITKVELCCRTCMICDIPLNSVYYDINIAYNRGGFSTSKYKSLCGECYRSLETTISTRINGCYP